MPAAVRRPANPIIGERPGAPLAQSSRPCIDGASACTAPDVAATVGQGARPAYRQPPVAGDCNPPHSLPPPPAMARAFEAAIRACLILSRWRDMAVLAFLAFLARTAS